MSDLFNKLTASRSLRIPCAYQAAAEVFDPETGDTKLLPVGDVILFDLQQVSPEEITLADAVLDEAKPPLITRATNLPGTVGSTMVNAGYDLEDPLYISARQKLMVKRDAYLFLMACPDLMESTPGRDIAEKAETIMKQVGANIFTWASQKAETMKFLTGFGEQEVALFLAAASGDAISSSDSNTKTPRGGRAKSSSGSTGQRSTTKKGKQRASGK